MSQVERLNVTAIAGSVQAGSSAVSVAQAVLDAVEAYDLIQPQTWILKCSPQAVLAAAAQVDARIKAGKSCHLRAFPLR